MRLIVIKLLLLVSILQSCSHTPNRWVQIMENAPGIGPVVFEPDLVSMDNRYEFGSTFSKDGSEFFGAVNVLGIAQIWQYEIGSDGWSTPDTILVSDEFHFADPFLSPDEMKLYFISNRPRNPSDSTEDYNIWYVERMPEGWSDPIDPGDEINSDQSEYYISFTAEGRMYFGSNQSSEDGRSRDFDIYYADKNNAGFSSAVRLDSSINSKAYEADVFIAPDESYMIFCSIRTEGLGQGDLYISRKSSDGIWSEAKSLGEPINTEHHELCPYVTPDGKYLFYTSREDIYWVSTEILEGIR